MSYASTGCWPGSEFPHVCGGYPDLAELLHLYRKLTSDYDDILRQVTEANTKVDEYMEQIETLIPGWMDARVETLKAEFQKMKSDLEKEMDGFREQVNQLLKEYSQKLDLQLKNQNAKVCQSLRTMQCWVSRTVCELKLWVKAKLEEVEQGRENDYQELLAKIKQNSDRLDAMENDWQEVNNAVQAKLDAFVNRIEEYNSYMRLWYYERRYEDKKWLMDKMEEFQKMIDEMPRSTLPVYNPLRDSLSSVQEFVDNWYAWVACRHGYSAGEWSSEKWITCQLFDESSITVGEFYIEGKHILDGGWRKLRVFSPVTGEYVWLGTAIQQIFDYLNADGITAQEYDDKQLTASQYDGKQVTAEGYLRKESIDV